ncbi:MAG: diaminopimelate epimerase, partial [Dehalococcoidia bacterium]|nr:diaminopimelate epimerase [Dehalococcoidia bacterium]
MKFTKMQGIGNDFILVEPGATELDWSGTAIAMCDRRFGIGADGLILVLPSEKADVRMRIFNSDGSEAEMCGNGIRCIARYALNRKLVKPRVGAISVESIPGIRKVSLSYDGGELTGIKVGMGQPEFAPGEIPVKLTPGTAVPVQDYPLVIGRNKLSLSF